MTLKQYTWTLKNDFTSSWPFSFGEVFPFFLGDLAKNSLVAQSPNVGHLDQCPRMCLVTLGTPLVSDNGTWQDTASARGDPVQTAAPPRNMHSNFHAQSNENKNKNTVRMKKRRHPESINSQRDPCSP